MKRKRVKEQKPLVSVVMPVYNAGTFLEAAIDSILAQTYRRFELILVNDASTDNSLKILKKYQRKFPRKITLVNLKQNHNHGGDSCANEGIKVARGKYIARMDADDISLPDRLDKQVAFLELHPDIFLIGSQAYVINQHDKIIGIKSEPQGAEKIHRAFFTFNPLIHPTAMFRAQFENKQKFFYQINYSANNDFFSFFKLSCQGAKFHNLSDKLLYHRIHESNDTFVNIKKKFMNTLKIRVKMVREYGYKPTLFQLVITLVQAVMVFTLPEKVTKYLYLISKGIIKVAQPKQKYVPHFSYN